MNHPGRFRYLPWLFRDAVRWPGLIYLIGVVGLSLVMPRVRGDGGVGNAESLLANVTSAMLTIASLLAVGGMIGGDREGGYYRIWFSHRLSPVDFYLQRLLVGLMMLLAWVVMMSVGFQIAIGGGNQLTPGLLAWSALGYLLVAGCVTLISHLTSRAWLAVFIAGWIQGMLGPMIKVGLVSGSVELLHRILPPTHLIQADPTGGFPPWDVVLHAGGYGLAALVLAMIILQRRSLGSGGRA